MADSIEALVTIHSELGASSYSRWSVCPGSIRLSKDVPKTTSVYAEEGTRAHDLAAKFLEGKLVEGYEELNEDDQSAIETYVDYVEFIREMRPSFEAVEQKLDLIQYHPKLFGTADYVAYFEKTKTLYVIDFKFGAGVPVEVVENEQLLYYGLAALHKNKFPIERVILGIVQPRCYHKDGPIRRWETNPMYILDFLADLIDNAKRTETKDAPLNPSEECRWCPAKGVCPALHAQSLEIAKNAFAPEIKYDPKKLSEVLSKLDQVDAWTKGVREFAYREAIAGRIPPGYKLVDKRASRKWAPGFSPRTDHAKLGLEENDFYEDKMKSLPQIEKIMDKKFKAELEKLTVKESSGQNLVPESDDREKVDNLAIAFG